MNRAHTKRNTRGHAVLEVALLTPWIFFLFVGAFDLGFYSYALICTENAARVAANYTSTAAASAADSAGACQAALPEMSTMANVNGLTSCSAAPLVVTATAVTGPDGAPASNVSITYTSSRFIPIPGLLMGQLVVTRTAQMRIRS